ncbi:hypothetical protein AAF712_003804 [Marasmius tenuissimus]|uniref:Uncharacterized protein n=1 Tax=Marasmius tenuissimus TaxID=585030 RepID=A0ABR3A629_9AGAR
MTPAGSLTPTASSSTTPEESRPQAGPLPLKRGEIGFQEELHGQAVGGQTGSSPEPVLPARHPEDRENVPTTTTTTSDSAQSSTNPPSATSPSPLPAASSSTSTLNKILTKPKKVSYGGVTLSTLLAFSIQLIMLLATISGWIVSTILLDRKHRNESDDGNSTQQGAISSSIFIHVVFAIATLGQLLFLERRLFRVRAERYAYLHPGEILPSHRGRRRLDPSVALSPWNRPPLPTYAAALAQSGTGTGDVEDHIIAQPPPPAYGNTRGSTLLLSGFLNANLRAQRPSSVHSANSATSGTDRPLSYRSTDSEWEVVQDVRRAQRLEETLATLESGTQRTQS